MDCGVDGCQTSAPEQAACFPITVQANDTDFAGFPCLEFVRTLEVPNMNCVLGNLHKFCVTVHKLVQCIKFCEETSL